MLSELTERNKMKNLLMVVALSSLALSANATVTFDVTSSTTPRYNGATPTEIGRILRSSGASEARIQASVSATARIKQAEEAGVRGSGTVTILPTENGIAVREMMDWNYNPGTVTVNTEIVNNTKITWLNDGIASAKPLTEGTGDQMIHLLISGNTDAINRAHEIYNTPTDASLRTLTLERVNGTLKAFRSEVKRIGANKREIIAGTREGQNWQITWSVLGFGEDYTITRTFTERQVAKNDLPRTLKPGEAVDLVADNQPSLRVVWSGSLPTYAEARAHQEQQERIWLILPVIGVLSMVVGIILVRKR